MNQVDYRVKTARRPTFSRPILYRYAVENAKQYNHNITLDFGSGPKAYNIPALQAAGYTVDAYDLTCDLDVLDQFTFNFYTPKNPPLWDYGLILASNVFNVQDSPKDLEATLDTLLKIAGDNATVLFNLPTGPWKGDWSWGNQAHGGSVLRATLDFRGLVHSTIPNTGGRIVKFQT